MKNSTPPKTPITENDVQLQPDDQDWLAIVAGKTPSEQADPKTVQEALALRYMLLKQAQAQETVSLTDLEEIKNRLRANGQLPKLPPQSSHSRFYDDWKQWLSWKKLTLVTVYTSLVAMITLHFLPPTLPPDIPTKEPTAPTPTPFIPKSQPTAPTPIATDSKVIEITCYGWQKLQKQLQKIGVQLTLNPNTQELIWPDRSFTADEWETGITEILRGYQITPEKHKFQDYSGLRTAGLRIKLLNDCQGAQ